MFVFNLVCHICNLSQYRGWCIVSFFHYRVDRLLDELKNDVAPYALDYTVFFKGFQSMGIDIFFSDIEHFIDFEAPMSDKWLDFMLVHTFCV